VALIDVGVVGKYIPNHEDTIGHQVTGPTEKPATIVGVVGAVKQQDLSEPPAMALYYPSDQMPNFSASIVIKTAGDPLALLPAVRREVAALDRGLPVSRPATMEQRLSDSLARRRIAVQLMFIFAALAALLAAIGIYGVLSYLVDQRRRELAIRMALGASAGQVVRLVTVEGSWPVAAGIVAGLAGAFASTRLLRSLLYEVSPTDPVVFSATVLLLAAAAAAAMLGPALRAVRVDPMTALRFE
jgi:putative ABC transport system permease protein